jgi:hypothetical protein
VPVSRIGTVLVCLKIGPRFVLPWDTFGRIAWYAVCGIGDSGRLSVVPDVRSILAGGPMTKRSLLPWKVVMYRRDAIPIVRYFQSHELAILCARILNTSSLRRGEPLSTWVESNSSNIARQE